MDYIRIRDNNRRRPILVAKKNYFQKKITSDSFIGTRRKVEKRRYDKHGRVKSFELDQYKRVKTGSSKRVVRRARVVTTEENVRGQLFPTRFVNVKEKIRFRTFPQPSFPAAHHGSEFFPVLRS